jgi:hypothetical protein
MLPTVPAFVPLVMGLAGVKTARIVNQVLDIQYGYSIFDVADSFLSLRSFKSLG